MVLNIFIVVIIVLYMGASMRVREVEFENEKSLIVYLTKEERKNENVISLIDEYKRLYRDVSVFVSGNVCIESILEKILTGKERYK